MDPEGARLLYYNHAYGKPRLCISIHHYAEYAPPCTMLQQAAALHTALQATRTAPAVY